MNALAFKLDSPESNLLAGQAILQQPDPIDYTQAMSCLSTCAREANIRVLAGELEAGNLGTRALLALGQLGEQTGDWTLAIEAYEVKFELWNISLAALNTCYRQR